MMCCCGWWWVFVSAFLPGTASCFRPCFSSSAPTLLLSSPARHAVTKSRTTRETFLLLTQHRCTGLASRRPSSWLLAMTSQREGESGENADSTLLDAFPTSTMSSATDADGACTDSADSEMVKHTAAPEPAPASSLFGCIALVAGTTVGAGILALPAETHEAGFLPTVVLLVVGWLYMSATGLLIAEVSVGVQQRQQERRLFESGDLSGGDGGTGIPTVSIPTMARETLGAVGARLSSLAFVFLHVALITAYILQGGSLLTEVWMTLLPSSTEATFLSTLGPSVFAITLGIAIVGLPEDRLELVNNAMVIGVITTFMAICSYGIPHVQPALLAHANLRALVKALPVIPVLYVFQTVVPTVCTLLRRDLSKIRTAIMAGTGVPLAMFLVWSYVILGIVSSDATGDPLVYIRKSDGSDAFFGQVVSAFSLLAVATSFLGFTYGLIDFYNDLLYEWKVAAMAVDDDEHSASADAANGGETTKQSSAANPSTETALSQWGVLALAIGPQVAIATVNRADPSFFFQAVDNAGIYGILVLFGLLPPAMAWIQRYRESPRIATKANTENDPGKGVHETVPVGKLSLGFIAATALVIIGLETWDKVGPLAAMVG